MAGALTWVSKGEALATALRSELWSTVGIVLAAVAVLVGIVYLSVVRGTADANAIESFRTDGFVRQDIPEAGSMSMNTLPQPSPLEVAWAQLDTSLISALSHHPDATWRAIRASDSNLDRPHRELLLVAEAPGVGIGFMVRRPTGLPQGFQRIAVRPLGLLATAKAVPGETWEGALVTAALGMPVGTPVQGEVFLSIGSGLQGALGVRIRKIGDVEVLSEPYVAIKDPHALKLAAIEAKARIEGSHSKTSSLATGALIGAALSKKGNQIGGAALGALAFSTLDDLAQYAAIDEASQETQEALPVVILPGQGFQVAVKPVEQASTAERSALLAPLR